MAAGLFWAVVGAGSGVVSGQPAPEPPTGVRAHGPEVAAAGLDLEAIEAIDVLLQEHVEAGHISGAVAIIVCDGEVGYREAFGSRDIEAGLPMEPDTLLRIYSMTKPIVGALAMTFWEEGAFGLDDPISAHLPEWKDATVSGEGGVEAMEREITVRDLLTHTSGISYKDLGTPIDRLPLGAVSQALAARPLSFQPGSAYLYGYSIDVLGRYLEVVGGDTLDVLLEERIFGPLGMGDTAFWVRTKADRERTAEVYTKRADGPLRVAMNRAKTFAKPKAMLGGQGLMSTADDYARFCGMLVNDGTLDGVRVLKAETVALMFEDHIESFDGTYGLGAWADGTGTYSWGGYAGTQFWVDREAGCFVVYMVQKVWYEPPTEGAFRALVKRAMGRE